MLIYLFFKNTLSMLHQNFQPFLTRSLTVLQTGKTKFKAVIRKYINTHSFYTVDAFVCVKLILVQFYIMFIVFYTLKLCIFVYL